MINDSVVKTMAATLTAFSTAARATFAGSIMPASNILPKVPLSASNPKSALKTYRQALLARAFEKMGKKRNGYILPP